MDGFQRGVGLFPLILVYRLSEDRKGKQLDERDSVDHACWEAWHSLSAKRDVFRIFLLLVLFDVEVMSLYFSHCHNPILRVSITQFYR